MIIACPLVLTTEFRARLAGLSLGYPENPAKLGSLLFSYRGLSWVTWVLKNHELSLVGFEKNNMGVSWVFWVSNTL